MPQPEDPPTDAPGGPGGATSAGGFPLTLGPNLRGRSVIAGGTARLALRGDFDLTAVDGVTSELHRLEERRPRVIVVDLDRVRFMDSKALEAMVAATFRARERGHRFAMRDAGGVATRVIRLAGVEGLIPAE